MTIAIDESRGERGRALKHIRRYTTWSLCFIVVCYTIFAVVEIRAEPLAVTVFIAGLLVAGVASYWEKPLPVGFAVLVLGASCIPWWIAVFTAESLWSAAPLTLALALVLSNRVGRLWLEGPLAWILTCLPLWAAQFAGLKADWGRSLLTISLMLAVALGLFLVNRYAWTLSLRLTSAGQAEEDLAILRERFRFASDLHDIQGHTLHLIRYKVVLAAGLLETDLPAAHAELSEAESLIVQTLQNTRELAFGDRQVSLAAELANARSLFVAAGINCSVIGDAPAAGQLEELFGLIVREGTTNIFRHAQATQVHIRVRASGVKVTNNGAPAEINDPRGLARLSQRFDAAGGILTTRLHEGEFSLEGRVA